MESDVLVLFGVNKFELEIEMYLSSVIKVIYIWRVKCTL